MPEKTYSTIEAARKAGVARSTLMRWLERELVKPSKEVTMPSGNVLRLFSEADIDKLKAYKETHYWEMNQTRRGGK